tara:strand:- start:1187 stop:1522 length:336 start_codon:yes stop_codon:yes gene_type:complete
MKNMKCVCSKTAEYEEHLKFNGYEVDGWKCNSCQEEYYNPKKVEKILLLNKLKKMKYHLKLSKVKSNLILRIPKEIGEVLDLHKGAEVELGLKSAKEIVLHPMEGNKQIKN